ncbi:MAG: 16S rRNA (guanine(527)-N(7))-methyltransferase RsmG [Hyphomicrobiales bacterium]|nr:16S rRNA (guanine(527)-N(7))-methyltransferase RsmG [Hyphomicrobiales bacterium]
MAKIPPLIRQFLATRGLDNDTTQQRLQCYVETLLKWTPRINLISKKDVPYLWDRHILDSAQLVPLLPTRAKTLTDFGSGGGLPALIVGALRPALSIHCIESDGRKCVFLEEAIRLMGLPNVMVHHARIETLSPWPSDVVTARALATCSQLLRYVTPYLAKEHLCLFLKGCNAMSEVADAGEHWTFVCDTYPSITATTRGDATGMNVGEEGVVLALRQVKPKKETTT